MAAIRQNVELEARLIDDLLDLTRVARGKLQLTFKTVAGRDQIHKAIRTVAGEARGKNITLVEEIEAGRHHVLADPARLQQILWNLLKNAIKFTPEGGTVTVRARNVEGQGGEGASSAPLLVVEVVDTGIGIEPAVLPKIFDAFEQGTPSITRRFGGLGLGLAISRALAVAHNGDLVAASGGRNQGSTFTLTLPTCAPVEGANEEAVPCPPAPKNAAPAGPMRILLVEDHASTASTLARLLRKLGHDVSVAGGVAAGLAVARAERFDLLISDIGLPDGTGLDLVRQLRATHPDLPAIALSGYGTEADVRRSLAAGFTQHLTKPINLEQLKGLAAVRGRPAQTS
jgi:CheY-like chemotaxis protein